MFIILPSLIFLLWLFIIFLYILSWSACFCITHLNTLCFNLRKLYISFIFSTDFWGSQTRIPFLLSKNDVARLGCWSHVLVHEELRGSEWGRFVAVISAHTTIPYTTLADYYARVGDIAKECDYGTHEGNMIWDHLILTMLKLRSKAIRENWVLDRILTEAALDKQTTEKAEAMGKKLDDERSSESIKKTNEKRWERRKHNLCGRCGNSDTHETCSAMWVTCDHPRKPNHNAKMSPNFTKASLWRPKKPTLPLKE